MSDKNGNGRGKYKPVVSYRYIDADVWVKENLKTGDETIAYTDEVIADVFGDEKSEDSNPNNSN
ncbi:MAG: hypothetical protein AAFQ41_00420 [Cyanobacteria bacterium J06623_7]